MEVDDRIQKLILFMVVNQVNYPKVYKSSSLKLCLRKTTFLMQVKQLKFSKWPQTGNEHLKDQRQSWKLNPCLIPTLPDQECFLCCS